MKSLISHHYHHQRHDKPIYVHPYLFLGHAFEYCFSFPLLDERCDGVDASTVTVIPRHNITFKVDGSFID
jgi:hypothetical protein